MPGRSMRLPPLVCALVWALAGAASAQVPEIRLARQYSMGYLQFNVMEHEKLIEKHAQALGLPQVKVSWLTFNGPTAINEALISGAIDIASGGTPGLLVLWARTKGTAAEVRGISALSSQPFLLNTRKAEIATIADFKDATASRCRPSRCRSRPSCCRWRRQRRLGPPTSPSSTR